MKRANLILLLILLSSAIMAQTNYYDYTADETITYDNFSAEDTTWLVGSFSNNCYSSKIVDNSYEITSVCNNSNPGFWLNNVNIDTRKDFEIEARILFVNGEDNNSISLMWGRDTSANRFLYGFSGNGQYRISKYSGSWNQLKNWTVSYLVHKADYNKLTVRKIGYNYYFFLNEVLVHTSQFEPFFGQQIGFQGNQNTTMRVQNFKVSYLKYHSYYAAYQNTYAQNGNGQKKENTATYFNNGFALTLGLKMDRLNGVGKPGDKFDMGTGFSFESLFMFKDMSLGLFSFDYYSTYNVMPGTKTVCQFWTFYFFPMDWRINCIANSSNRFVMYVAPSIAPQLMSVDGTSGVDYSWIFAFGFGTQYAISEKYFLNFQVRPYLESGNQLRKNNAMAGGIEFKINIARFYSFNRW
jgi:hypothetical protein